MENFKKITDLIFDKLGVIRKNSISDVITKERIDEANKVKKNYEKKFKNQSIEHDLECKKLKDEYTGSLNSRRDFYEKELKIEEKRRILDLENKQREIEELKSEINKMTSTYEEASHKLKSMTLLMNDIKSYLENIEKRDVEEARGYKMLEQRLSFIQLGLSESKFLEG